MKGYWQLLKTHPRTLGFGLIFCFFSGYGQTHFISLFNPFFKEIYQLSNTDYGLIYSLVTLASGIILPWVGPLIDKKDARWFGVAIAMGLILCEVLLASFQNLVILCLALFGLRLFGQGLSSHIAATTMARYFEEQRGKALSLAFSGFPIYEGLITPLCAYILGFISWQSLSWSLALIAAFTLLPLSYWLTKNIPEFNFPRREEEIETQSQDRGRRQWTRKQVYSHPLIYLLLIQFLMPPFSLTGLLFHQAAIGEFKGWSLSIIASGLSFFALGRFFTAFLAGPLVDRYTARRLYPYYQIPLTIGFLGMSLLSYSWIPALCFIGFGITVGSGAPIKSAIWPELYGTRHLGAIKSSFATIMVMSTAASPFLFGWILDQQQQAESLLLAMAILSLVAAALSILGLKRYGF
ncbi:MAG: MFS transporter [Bdellovibrionales bacterium]|nr:MFS transporter [Bdellovibrionales bacterium]